MNAEAVIFRIKEETFLRTLIEDGVVKVNIKASKRLVKRAKVVHCNWIKANLHTDS